MNKKGFTISVTAGIALILLLIGGTGSYTYLFNIGSAQRETLGDPIFVERVGIPLRENWDLTGLNTPLLLVAF